MSTVKVGKAAEHLVISKLLKEGIDCYVPVTEDNKIDLIYIRGGRIVRAQIKVIQRTKAGVAMSVRKTHTNSKEHVIKRYSSSDIDEFIGVDLLNDKIYFIPVIFSEKYRAAISLSIMEEQFPSL